MKTWISLLCTIAMICISAGKAWADPAPLFEDTFTGIDPSFGTNLGTAVQVKGGKMIFTLPGGGWERLIYQVGFFADCDMSLTVSSVTGDISSSNNAGIIFWGIDNTDFYEFVVGADGTSNVYRMSGGRWLNPASIPPSSTVNKGLGASNLLRVVTKGNQATCYINGTQVTAITGMPPAGGGLVGLYTQSTANPATLTVQDFKILPAPLTPPSQ
jgi:hypothetical protein